MNKEFGLLRLEVNGRFEEVNNKMDKNHEIVLTKIYEIRPMETEDIQVIYKDIEGIKKALPA